MRAAQLADERYLAEIELLMEQNKVSTSARPSVANDIRLLIRAMTQGGDVEFHQMPMTPVDRIKERKKLISRAKIAELLEGG